MRRGSRCLCGAPDRRTMRVRRVSARRQCRARLSTSVVSKDIFGYVPEKRREVRDPRALRALAHPVRLELLERLTDGPLTATQAASIVGESQASCSFHLRQLAKYGFVELAGDGAGR